MKKSQLLKLSLSHLDSCDPVERRKLDEGQYSRKLGEVRIRHTPKSRYICVTLAVAVNCIEDAKDFATARAVFEDLEKEVSEIIAPHATVERWLAATSTEQWSRQQVQVFRKTLVEGLVAKYRAKGD